MVIVPLLDFIFFTVGIRVAVDLFGVAIPNRGGRKRRRVCGGDAAMVVSRGLEDGETPFLPAWGKLSSFRTGGWV